MENILIIGAGQMGLEFGENLSKNYNINFFDIDFNKSTNAAKLCNSNFITNIDEILNYKALILAIPKEAIIDFFLKYYIILPPFTLCINISSFLTLTDIYTVLKEHSIYINANIVSCKLIAHFKRLKGNYPIPIIVEHNSHIKSEINAILSNIGTVIFDKEKKYSNLNLIIAEKAMRSVLESGNELIKLGYRHDIVLSAINSVFIGTAEQFPYETPDYFHNAIYEKYSDIKQLKNNFTNNLKKEGIINDKTLL